MLAAVHIPTGLPLYYELISGNIIDNTVLESTIENLKHFGCEVEHFSGDAGFGNIAAIERLIFLDNLISFTTRLNSNYNIFKNAINSESINLLNGNCESFKHKNRIIRCRKTSIQIIDKFNNTNKKEIFIYIFLDEDTRAKKIYDLKKSKRYISMTVEEYDREIKNYGIFAIISIRNLTPQQVLDEYYDRIYVEQFFRVIKNTLDAEPLRLQSQETIQGHILLCFISSFIHIIIKRRMKLFDSQYINIAPTYNNENFLECDPADFKNDILNQTPSKKLTNTPLSDLFYELRGQFANVYFEKIDIGSKKIPIATVVPVPPNAQASAYYQSFGLVTPLKIIYLNNKCKFYYRGKKINDNIKKLAFADHLCKEDLKKLSEQDKNKKEDNDQSCSDFELDNFFKIFDARVKGRSSGRPKGSLNKATLAKIAEARNQAFNHFDNFFDFWSPNEAEPKRKVGRPKGSLNKATLAKMAEASNQAFNHFDSFFDFWTPNEAEPKRKVERPKGSLNTETIVKQKA